MTKPKLAVVGAIAAAVAIPLWMQHRCVIKLREENESLRQQAEQLPLLSAENERLSNLLATANSRMTSNQSSELLKLRGEVASLRRQADDAVRREKSRPVAPQRSLQTGPTDQQMEQQKEMAIAKMSYAKNWMLAFHQYAGQHQGQIPTNFDLAAAFLPEEMRAQTNLAPEQFEIAFTGSVFGMTNLQNVIVIREKEAWPTLDGGWAKGYSFADGHSEIHKAADGNFQPWEAEHTIAPPAPGPPDQ